MWTQRLMGAAWPAFLAACVLELFVFAFADPQDLHWGAQPLGWSRQSIYTVAFFVFWLVSFASGALAVILQMTPAEINDSQG
jgi:hypothetical protein